MDLVRALFASKKFIAAIIGIVVAVGARYGLNLDPDLVREIVLILIAYILAQGVADHGKDAAKINAAVEVNPARAREMVKADSQP